MNNELSDKVLDLWQGTYYDEKFVFIYPLKYGFVLFERDASNKTDIGILWFIFGIRFIKPVLQILHCILNKRNGIRTIN